MKTYAMQVVKQINDLRPSRNVERRCRLVGDNDVGSNRKSAGNAGTLALPAGEFVRVEMGRCRRQSDSIEKFDHLPPSICSGADTVHQQRLLDDPPDGEARIQRRLGVLEDHLDVFAHGTQPASSSAGDFLPQHANGSGAWMHEADKGSGER